MRLNLRTFSTFLDIVHDDLRATTGSEITTDEPTERLTPAIRRALPALRLYSVWLFSNAHIIAGLASDDQLQHLIDEFWKSYTRTVNVVADEDVLGIWTLEDYRASYMLEEDTDSLAFKPIQNELTKVWRNWYEPDNSTFRPRFSDNSVSRLLPDEEMLARLMGLLEDGLYLANDVSEAPINLLGTKVYYGQPPAEAVAAIAKTQQELQGKPLPKPKPLSYAAAANKNKARQVQKATKPATVANGAPKSSAHSRQAQLSRMVDELVDEDEGSNPVTPPQQHATCPQVINGDGPMNGLNSVQPGAHEFAAAPSYQPKGPTATVSSAYTASSPPILRTPKESLAANSLERMQSVSSIWNNMPTNQVSTSPSFPSALPMGTLSSPAQINRQGHSRINSASSVRSRTSQNAPMGDSWSSLGSAPGVQAPPAAQMPTDGYARFSTSGMASPLLFGAGTNMWSTGASAYKNVTPPNGQGG